MQTNGTLVVFPYDMRILMDPWRARLGDIVLQLINLRVIVMPKLDVMLTSKNMDSWCMCGHGVFTFLTLSIDRGMMLNYTKSSPIGQISS